MNARRDPRIQQTLNRITDTLESANAATQTSFYDFSSRYLGPCLQSVNACLNNTCAPCLNLTRERQRQRQRALMRSQRPEAVFDFYADWDDDAYEYGSETPGEGSANERTGLLGGWGADELDRLLAGPNKGKETEQPKRQRGMSYGTNAQAGGRKGSAGRKTKGTAKTELNDPTVVPTSSKFGFLESLPFRFGARGMKYKPSTANLQEGVFDKNKRRRPAEEERERTEGEALLEDVDEEDEVLNDPVRTGRARSGTNRSTESDTSYSSRGDLFPSDDEDDAVMIDDEFAMTLGRRNTNDFGPSSNSSERGKRKRPSASRKSTSTKSRATRSSGASMSRVVSGDSIAHTPKIEQRPEEQNEAQTDEELRREEEQVRLEEAAGIESRRKEAHAIAVAKGLIEPEGEGAPTVADSEATDAVLEDTAATETTGQGEVDADTEHT